ncbi:MAG: hypothetical protein P8X64_15055 [Anaerolineales bacterium]
MASTPRSTIDDSYTAGLRCAICGAEALRVGHVANLPDYVTCGECGSAFLVEQGGERIFYGQIAAGYAGAEQFALRQWAFAEAIENRAKSDRPTLPDFEETVRAEAPAAEPEPEPPMAAPAVPQAPPPEPLPSESEVEAEAPAAEPEPEPIVEPPAAPTAIPEQAPPEPESEPPEPEAPAEATEPEPAGSEFDFLSELAAAGPSPEPTEEPAAGAAEADEGEFDFLAALAAEGPGAEPADETAFAADEDESAGAALEPQAAAPELEGTPEAEPGETAPDEAEEDFLLGLMAGEAEVGPPDVKPAPEPESGVDFEAGLEAAEETAEPQASGLIDSDEPHPADTLTPPPWARPAEPEGEVPEAAPPVSWHEFSEEGESAEPDITSEFFPEPTAEDTGETPSDAAEDDPLGLASAFEALTPDSGEAGAADEEGAETPAWMQFEDVEAAPEEADEFDAFASLRAESDAEHPQAEPEEEAPEAGAEEQFEPFEFNQRMSTFGGAEEDEELEGVTEDEDDFLSGLRRSAAVPLESEPLPDTPLSGVNLESKPAFAAEEPVPDEEPGEDPLAMAARLGAIAAEPAAEAVPEWMQEEPEEEEAEAEETRGAFHLRETDPPPGQRYRVVLLGDRVVFPGGDCAHCGRTPVKGRLAVYGTLPNGQKVGQRKVTSFNVPLCDECRERAALQTEDASNARLQAHLISGIIGMVLVVLALVTGIIDTSSLGVVDIMILVILALVGYAGPVTFLLNRAGNYPPPPDAAYVRTTLLVPSETQGLETAFEWRNEEYARRFFEANQANTIGHMTPVKDRLAPVG